MLSVENSSVAIQEGTNIMMQARNGNSCLLDTDTFRRMLDIYNGGEDSADSSNGEECGGGFFEGAEKRLVIYLADNNNNNNQNSNKQQANNNKATSVASGQNVQLLANGKFIDPTNGPDLRMIPR